jgi:prolyl 4-hydroxylase
MNHDADRLFETAVALLLGTSVRRSVPDARRHFRAAAAAGHVDAALFEIALGANGSGGPVDWAASHALLRHIAPRSDTARQHLAMLADMDIDDAGYPRQVPRGETAGVDPRLTLFRNFLSPDECAHVMGAVADIVEPSYVVDPRTGQMRADPIRTSSGAVVGPTRETLVIGAINRRIAAISETPVAHGEPLSVLHYRVGEQYRPHLDALPPGFSQRVATVIVYLNDGYGGGETHFPHSDVKIAGRRGDALLFRNILPSGAVDRQAVHAGMPVTTGSKWVATRWIRASRYDPWTAGTSG